MVAEPGNTAVRRSAERVLSLHRGEVLTTLARNEVFYQRTTTLNSEFEQQVLGTVRQRDPDSDQGEGTRAKRQTPSPREKSR